MSSCRQCLFCWASFCIVIPKILSVLCQSCVQLKILNLIKSAVVHNSDTWVIVLKYFRSVPTGNRTLIWRMRGERSTTKEPRRSYECTHLLLLHPKVGNLFGMNLTKRSMWLSYFSRHYMAEILPIQRKALSNQLINQSYFRIIYLFILNNIYELSINVQVNINEEF